MTERYAIIECVYGSEGFWLGQTVASGEYKCLHNWSAKWVELTSTWTEEYLLSVGDEGRYRTTIIDEDHPRFGEICAMRMKHALTEGHNHDQEA